MNRFMKNDGRTYILNHSTQLDATRIDSACQIDYYSDKGSDLTVIVISAEQGGTLTLQTLDTIVSMYDPVNVIISVPGGNVGPIQIKHSKINEMFIECRHLLGIDIDEIANVNKITFERNE